MSVYDAHERDFKLLNLRIKKLVEDGLIKDRSQAPIFLLLSHRFHAEDDLIHESYTDGGNDCGVDAIYIDRNMDEPEIHVIQSRCHSSTRKSKAPFKANSLEKLVRFFEILKNKNSNLPKVVNYKLEQKILEIRDIQKKDFPKIIVWLLSNGQPCVDHEVTPLLERLEQSQIKVREFHLTEFVEFCIKRRSSRTDHTFYARDIGVLDYGPSDLNSVVGLISARELYDLLKDLRDERKIDYSVFDMNVRGFLGTDTEVNKEIFRSALSKENHHFSSLNNGITIIGSNVKIMKTGDQPKIGIKNMNIVNGAQTCSAIFDAMKVYFPDFGLFDSLSVLFRVFGTENRDLIEQISLSTNSQNKINSRDLKANDEVQRNIEKFLLGRGIKYIRKRGDYGVETGDLAPLDALKAGQIILSYVHLDPARAKRDSDSIFMKNYGKIFHNFDMEKLIEGYEVYKIIEKKRSFIEDEIRIRGATRTENTFVTYGAFHILALCSALKEVYPKVSVNELIEKSL